ncbi:Alpha/Beta hydrolase protein [Paraphoma chrysanthemicola]|uniref:Alpha/Beta hydrolase protein n=1 Tax=Paraphoma chrysanthemicola TaxID=798071 RepID=A0A8K0W2K1_9PLEO|nr:Alpha/Beta hydrolase protein [Paraphoma chrysanthemicola]
MASTNSLRIQDDKLSSLGLTKTVVNKEEVACYSRNLSSVSEKNPILVLLHGYPQSAYMWRHLIPLLPKDAPIFAPDLPGYGGSPPISQNDKLSIGNAVFSALKTEVKRTTSGSSSNSIPVYLIGHDRGARISHRLVVSGHEGIDILGVCLIDIVPSSAQWQHFVSPVQAAKEAVGYFHWPFLADVPLATRMIKAYGGAKWCTECIMRWSGKSSPSQASLQADDALSVYGGFFEQDSVIEASNEDYKHGATTDLEAQEEDQKAGRKIEKPLLLIYSSDFIGSRYDFESGGVWKEWTADGVKIRDHGLGKGVGHFGAEEAPEECAKVIGEWLKEVGGGGARL